MNREPVIADAIARVVAAHPLRRVPLQEILKAAAAVDRTAAGAVGWRARVLAAIEALEEAKLLEVPHTRWDTTSRPPLPMYVTRPAADRPESPAKPSVVWHAELAWAARLDDEGALTVGERRFLATINSWLPKRRGVVVPLRERSLELFDDEKVLEGWVLGPLFAPGKLSLEQLEAFPCWPPVTQIHLGEGPWLVVENYTTYRSIGARAEELGFDGRVVWGSGNQVGTRLSALVASAFRPVRCWYFGDIDKGGFGAAKLACSRAKELDLPEMTPARGLYRLALKAAGNRRAVGTRAASALVEWARTWLGGALGDTATQVLTEGQRVVQEHVGQELLAGTDLGDWFE